MDSIIVNIFTDTNEGLASFGIYYLSLKGHKLVDDSLSTSIVLCDVQLDDIRPNRENKITRFMKRREEDNQFNVSMLNADGTATTADTGGDNIPAKSMIDVVCNIRENDMFGKIKILFIFASII